MASMWSATAILLLPLAALAGWGERAPTPINLSDAPGKSDIHHVSSLRRIVRIHNSIVALCPRGDGGERTFRSTDDGASWKMIDDDGTYSGCLATGPDSLVYHFYFRRGGGSLQVVKFKYNAPVPLPAPRAIHTSVALTVSAVPGQYGNLHATVDRDGTIYLASHWGSPDRIQVFRSEDAGETWKGPFQASSENAKPWFYPNIEADGKNGLVLAYQEWGGDIGLRFARSRDRGETWSVTPVHPSLNSGTAWNPCLVAKGGDSLYIFAQGQRGRASGLFSIRSLDGGASWEKIRLIEPTCRYADPAAAVGADGSLYVAFRRDVSDDCGAQTYERLTVSRDGGLTWKMMDGFAEAKPPTGTRSAMRYQAWWNYGGPLEWTWMQTEVGGHNLIYYDVNADVRLLDRTAGAVPARPAASGPRRK